MTSFNLPATLDMLAGQELPLGVFLVGAGLVFMIVGFRVSRPLAAISMGAVTFMACTFLPVGEGTQLGLGFMGALAMGAASTYFTRTSVAVLAGAWAGYATLLLVGQVEIPVGAQLAIAGLAFVGAASMSLIMCHEVTAFVLSFEGSLLLIAGLVIFMNREPVLWIHIREMMVGNPIFAPFVLMAGAVTGFYWQTAELRQRDAGTSSG